MSRHRQSKPFLEPLAGEVDLIIASNKREKENQRLEGIRQEDIARQEKQNRFALTVQMLDRIATNQDFDESTREQASKQEIELLSNPDFDIGMLNNLNPQLKETPTVETTAATQDIQDQFGLEEGRQLPVDQALKFENLAQIAIDRQNRQKGTERHNRATEARARAGGKKATPKPGSVDALQDKLVEFRKNADVLIRGGTQGLGEKEPIDKEAFIRFDRFISDLQRQLDKEMRLNGKPSAETIKQIDELDRLLVEQSKDVEASDISSQILKQLEEQNKQLMEMIKRK